MLRCAVLYVVIAGNRGNRSSKSYYIEPSSATTVLPHRVLTAYSLSLYSKPLIPTRSFTIELSIRICALCMVQAHLRRTSTPSVEGSTRPPPQAPPSSPKLNLLSLSDVDRDHMG